MAALLASDVNTIEASTQKIASCLVELFKYTNMEIETKIMQQLAEIKALTLLAAKEMLTMDDAVLYTGLGKSCLYVLTCKKKIPFYKPNGKNIYFKKSELNDWLQRNRVASEE